MTTKYTVEGPFWDDNAGDEYVVRATSDDGLKLDAWGHTPEEAIRAYEEGLVRRGLKKLCPCCDKGLVGLDGDDICQVCWWHDDGYMGYGPDEVSGANGFTMNEAKANVAAYGYCCPHGMWCGTGKYPDGHVIE